MAQRKETKKTIKVRDLKPKKDAKGGFNTQAPHGVQAAHDVQVPKASKAPQATANDKVRAAPRFDPACGFMSIILLLIKN